MKDNPILNDVVSTLIITLYNHGYSTDVIIDVLVKIGFTKKQAKEYLD